MLNKLTVLLKEEREKIDKYKAEVMNLPKGNIYIREKNGQVYVEVIDGNKKQGISKRPEQIYGLARKEYVDFLLQREKAYCKVLKNMVAQISKIDDEIDRSRVLKKLNKLSGRGIDLQKIYWTDAEYEWARAEFESNPYNSEALKYMTTKGVKVRSKSERIIGNKLEEYNLPYRYEPKIIIDGKVYYPDFVIMCPDGSLVIWEHLGLMDDERYKMNAFVKIADYRKLGYVQHKNLVCTWEEDLAEMNTIDEIIQRFILKMPV